MNNNYNNISFDYIGAIGTHTITDYIDINSNILNDKIDITSNFLNTNIDINSNILNDKIDIKSNILKLYTDTNITNLDNKYNKLIDQRTIIETYGNPLNTTDYNVKHTYISNSNIDNVYSEIRFYCKNAINYPTFEITESPLHKVKIGNDGRLYIWYAYNPSISLTLPSQWVDVNQEIGKQQADGLNQGAAIVGVENQIIIINTTLTELSGEIISLYGLSSGSSGSGGLSGSAYNVPNLDNGIITTAAIDNIRNNLLIRAQTVQNYVANLGGATGILAVIWGIAEGLGRTRYTNTMMDQLRSNLSSNLEIGNIENANIISNTINYTSNNYLTSNLKDVYDNYSNLGILQGFINSNIQTQQIIPNLYSYNLKTSLLNLNSGNIVNVNNITSSGKIKENNIFLESTYATIDYVNTNLFNNSYTTERLYPSKTFNSYTLSTTTNEILGRQSFKETITLTSDGITYGNGTYNIYSSSSYGNSDFNKRNLFNFTVNSAAFWGSGNYNYETGFFNRNDMFLKNNYFGDWVVIKLLTPLILNHFKLYYTNIYSAPSLWRFYGSNDGLTFTEIPEGGNFIDPLNIDNYSGGFYEKIFSNVKEYIYLGIVINKIIGGNISASYLNFGKFELYGVNVNNYNNIYTTSNVVKSIVRNEMPDVPKRKVFIVSIPSSSTFFDGTTSTTFYKWDLDLTKYTTTQLIASDPPTGDLLRNFKISFWYVPSYFGSYLNAEPYVVSYTVFMSNKSNPIFGKPQTAGINIYAVGFPENIKLNNILPNNLMLLKNYFGNFNYLTIVSRNAPADIYVVIEDQLF
jgi:hypothetical protein